ncbi:MAG TPA: response regulator [Polyangia bacterium]|nr:response regulator [Polyangia bacterium]
MPETFQMSPARGPGPPGDGGFERGQRELIERIATGVSLGQVLERLVRLIEAQASDMMCSVLLLDPVARCVRHGAAPSLPVPFVAAIDGESIGPAAGSCGTAAYLGEPVVVEDIATHPAWASYRDVALTNGLRACWSSPIFSIDRHVLGTFAMYYREPRAPRLAERAWVERATHLAAIAIERDRATETLRAQELRLAEQAALLDQAKDAILVRDLGGAVRFWNRGAEVMYGWPRAEAVGRPISDLIYKKDELAALAEAERALLAAGSWTGELTQVTRAGVELEVEGRWTLLRGSPGAPPSILAINTDVTERNRLHQHVLRAQRMDSLGTLAGGIAHDFNNILASLTANAAFALETLPVGHGAREFLGEIARASERATELVRQILTFGRRQEPKAEVVQAGSIAAEVRKLLRATLPATVELRLRVDDDAPAIFADPIQVHQVLMNLGTNAAQALPEGRGHVEVRVARRVVERPVTTAAGPLAPGTYAELVVIDDGSGMDAKTMEHIFDPFFTTKGPSVGTGLGLAVVHGVAKCHAGGVFVESALGVGSRFSVLFPEARPRASASTPARPATTAAHASGVRVLCLDDEEAIVRITVRRLERLGYVVVGASDARAALDRFRAEPDAIDVLLTDYSMPGLTGVDLVRAFRAVRPDLPVVLTSGLVDDHAARALAELGVDHIVLKPSTIEELAAALASAVGRGRATTPR